MLGWWVGARTRTYASLEQVLGVFELLLELRAEVGQGVLEQEHRAGRNVRVVRELDRRIRQVRPFIQLSYSHIVPAALNRINHLQTTNSSSFRNCL
jgi:hypothetical protein